MKSLSFKLGLILLFMWVFVSYGITEAEEDKWTSFESNGKWGFKDENGNVTVEPQFDFLYFFSEGLAAALMSDKFGFIDKYGKYVISPRFDNAGFFREGLAAVKVEKKWGFIDKKGNYVIGLQFEDTKLYLSEGLVGVKLNGKWGYINKSGVVVIPYKFDDVSSFSPEGLASVKVGDRWGFINQRGDMVIDPKFELAYGKEPPDFYYGKARVNIEGNEEIIDVRGDIISPDWELCSIIKDSITYYNKKKLLFPSKNIVRVWTRYINVIDRESLLALEEIDCPNARSKLLSLTNYDKKGDVKTSKSYSHEKSEWKYIVPDTIMDTLSRKVCPKQPK